MIPELGQFVLILALCVALVQGTLPLAGAHYGRREWMLLARPCAQVLFLLLAAAFAALTWTFYTNDFQCSTSRHTPTTNCPHCIVLARCGAGTKARFCYGC